MIHFSDAQMKLKREQKDRCDTDVLTLAPSHGQIQTATGGK